MSIYLFLHASPRYIVSDHVEVESGSTDGRLAAELCLGGSCEANGYGFPRLSISGLRGRPIPLVLIASNNMVAVFRLAPYFDEVAVFQVHGCLK